MTNIFKYFIIASVFSFSLLSSSALFAGSQINSTTTSSSTDNVGYGYQTLNALTSGVGNYNTAVGHQSPWLCRVGSTAKVVVNLSVVAHAIMTAGA